MNPTAEQASEMQEWGMDSTTARSRQMIGAAAAIIGGGVAVLGGVLIAQSADYDIEVDGSGVVEQVAQRGDDCVWELSIPVDNADDVGLVVTAASVIIEREFSRAEVVDARVEAGSKAPVLVLVEVDCRHLDDPASIDHGSAQLDYELDDGRENQASAKF